MGQEKIENLRQILPIKITDISPQKKRKDRFSLFHNGEFLIGVSGNTLLSHNIQKGMELNSTILRNILGNEEYQAVKESCYRYLSGRDHSAHELKLKITKKGYDPGIADEVILDLSEKGLINDRRFAEKFASDKMELQKWGPSKIRNALLKKGIARETTQKVTQKLSESLEQHGICVDLLRKRKAYFLRETDTLKRKQKMYRYLAGKGFRTGDITRALGLIKNEFDVK